MIFKFNLIRLSIIFLLVIIFPLVQNQWLNLYLFDVNNFTFYKLLYYLSGLIFPFLVCITSLSNFTFYKFNNIRINSNFDVDGKSLLLTTSLVLIAFSTLISNYIFFNYKLILNLFITDNKYLINFDIDKQILFIVIISFLLLFNKIKIFIKKIILINFLIISFILWHAKISNISIASTLIINNFLEFENLNSINVLILLAIEIVFYLWSYISNSSNLSDWRISLPSKKDLLGIFNIIFFYLIIILYYSILSE